MFKRPMVSSPCCRPKMTLPARAWMRDCSCAVVGGLLCSSCCVVQLALNSMSIGCAGFAVLTPYRPAFLTATAAGLGYNFVKYHNKKRSAVALAIAVGLAVTPEVVRLYNENRLPFVRRRRALGDRVQLMVRGMKCLACSAGVKKRILSQVGGIEACEIEFETGRVTLKGRDIDPDLVIQTVMDMGFDAQVQESGPRLDMLSIEGSGGPALPRPAVV